MSAFSVPVDKAAAAVYVNSARLMPQGGDIDLWHGNMPGLFFSIKNRKDASGNWNLGGGLVINMKWY